MNISISSIYSITMPRSKSLAEKIASLTCPKCSKILSSAQALTNHLARIPACDDLEYKCKACHSTFKLRKTLKFHVENNCRGTPQNEQNRNLTEELQQTRIAMSAMGTHEQRANGTSSSSIQNGDTNIGVQNNNIHIGDINNVQINVNVVPKGAEDIDFLKNMPYDELIKLIGCRCSPSTHIQLFELIRCNPDLPQNQNMLLTSMDSKIVYWNSTTGWRQGDFNEQIHGRIADDALFLVGKIPPHLRDPEFYGSHVHEVLRNCGEMTNPLMKQIAEGIRRPLHEATMNLVAKYRPVVEEEVAENQEASSSGEGAESANREDVILVREKIKLAEIESRKAEVEKEKFMMEIQAMQMRKEEQDRQQIIPVEVSS